MQAKVCGLSTTEQVKTCIAYGANFCGFILNYKKSHRFINYQNAEQLTQINKKDTFYVGVLVNPSREELKSFSNLNLDYFQIYGDYTNEDIFKIKNKFKKKIISSIQVKNKDDVMKYKSVSIESDIVLWDSSGLEKSLEWNYDWIKSVPGEITKMIAGNISINKLNQISKIADIVDVSGALETNKVKDIGKIKLFLNKIKKVNNEN
jgi:phosphoribosylanthranilate isomerase